MRNFLNNTLLFAAILATSVAVSFAVVTLAHADVSCAVSGAAQDDNSGLSNPTYVSAEKVIFSSDCAPTSIEINVRENGTITDDFITQIEGDNAGEPDGSVLLTGTLTSADITGSFSDVTMTFDGLTTIPAGTYWMTHHRTGTLDVINFIDIGLDNNGSHNWLFSTDSGGTWTDFGAGISGLYTIMGSDTPPPPPTPSGLEATSTVDQTEQNAWNALFAFIAIVWMVLWIGKKN